MALEIHHKARTQRAIDKGQKSFRGRQDEGRDTHPTGIMDYLQFHGLLPTPIAWDGLARGGARPIKDGKTTYKHQYGARLKDMAKANLLPTPTAIEGVKWAITWNPKSQMGQSLSAMAASGMLPTPQARDYKQDIVDEKLAQRSETHQTGIGELIATMMESQDLAAGETSRLSPLFTEEVMGFPFLWTTFSFPKVEERKHQSLRKRHPPPGHV